MTSSEPLQLRAVFTRYLGVMQLAIKTELAYRFEFFSAILGSLLTMLLVYYLWTAIYNSAESMAMSYSSLITYVCLGQAFSFARPGQRRVIARISSGIRNGNIIFDLVRPADYQALNFAETMGSYLMETLLVSLPAYLVALLFFDIDLPASPEAALGFVLSLGGAFLLVFAFDFFIGLLTFWTFSVWGLTYAKIAVTDILAGTLIPLTLFPGWLRSIALLLPFQGMAYTPLSIYTGAIEGTAIWTSIAGQLAWTVVLFGLTRLLWLKARRRLEIQGG
ncbi:MAG: ABC-2 family transporter protein [Caldilineaceae bacterium]|nr:ABC-2 family transporter protein [Caldilineaceae bacterium]